MSKVNLFSEQDTGMLDIIMIDGVDCYERDGIAYLRLEPAA